MDTHVRGHSIQVYGRIGESCWQTALDSVLNKLLANKGQCQHLAKLSTDDAIVLQAAAEARHSEASHENYRKLYKSAPLFCCSSSLRGLRLQALAFEIDRLLRPQSEFSLPATGDRCDWLRDAKRIEFKQSIMQWNSQMRRWQVCFTDIKLAFASVRACASFDELWLGIYSPKGLYIFQHNGTLGVATHGVSTPTRGHRVIVGAHTDEDDIDVALLQIRSKFEANSCHWLATVCW
eukprot:TRINITY_DN96345_c0_g1_i1.p1 TRINITY_DN96345_c0_g1~~TRINITY_DN96345_c0_g1_i1.p1  ORF type:complete len:276 (-),score=18.47 TRINITY_DN96345_c0_g1_i1:18-722(-)